MADEQFGQRVAEARALLGLSAAAMGDMMAVDAQTITAWERGRSVPRRKKREWVEERLSQLATRVTDARSANHIGNESHTYGTREQVPLYLLGHIAGTTDGEGERINDLDVPGRLGRMADQAFVIHGSSMEPWFLNGDIVGIRTQPVATEGQLVVALVDGELTFKRYDGQVDDRTILCPLNSEHAPVIAREARIIGVYRWSIRESRDGKI